MASGWRWERAYDVALGLSAISWAGLGLWGAEARPWSVRLALAALNLLVGGLLLIRHAPLASGGPRAVLAALPSLILGGAAVRLADGPWPLAAQALFGLGAAGACASLATLGRSFAFLPSRRGLVVRGPYRLVRHPAYLSELLMALACATVRPWPGALLAGGAALTLALRIRAEERLLARDEGWAAYRARVRWRLLPGLY
ncbi:MAG TPA: isoprenylcysteine carboxylmethyltransferase family protein [Sandaracinaceae bacterium LLY-WYZ-13_1]|nr:isoprenylcysteine carboxylmethyltransferase family protein [Sandaracinaceae bacterium LLY-WYZ-13_1]